jgi:hypothetical protein
MEQCVVVSQDKRGREAGDLEGRKAAGEAQEQLHRGGQHGIPCQQTRRYTSLITAFK